MVAFFCPPAFFASGEAPSSGYSFTMTAGDIFDAGMIFGYLAGDNGNIDGEPLPTVSLSAFIYDPSSVIGQGEGSISFEGEDVTSLLSGKTVWVDSVEYAADFSGWAYDDGFTSGIWTDNAPAFVENEEYFIEIK